jgi:hypothetical protein
LPVGQFVGRAEELAVFEHAVTEVTGGQPRAIARSGEPELAVAAAGGWEAEVGPVPARCRRPRCSAPPVAAGGPAGQALLRARW